MTKKPQSSEIQILAAIKRVRSECEKRNHATRSSVVAALDQQLLARDVERYVDTLMRIPGMGLCEAYRRTAVELGYSERSVQRIYGEAQEIAS